MLVHFEFGDVDHLPDSFQLLMIDVPDSLSVITLDEHRLSPDWRTLEEETRAAGDAWLGESNSAILSIPSAIVPHTKNYLINPLHPEAKKIKIRSYGRYPFDSRLFK
jgi:RES domain-containing protein